MGEGSAARRTRSPTSRCFPQECVLAFAVVPRRPGIDCSPRMPHKTTVDVFETEFGAQLGPDLIQCVQEASLDQLRDLQDRVSSGPRPEPPSKTDGRLRPYVPFGEIRGGLDRQDFMHPQRAQTVLNGLRHHLLYCDSLAIEDPLPGLLDHFALDEPVLSLNADKNRRKLVGCLHSLDRVQPLIRAGVLVLVDTTPELRTRVDLLDDPVKVAGEADFADVPPWKAERLEEGGQIVRELLINSAAVALSRMLDAADEHPDAVDLCLPFAYYEQTLRAVAQEAEESVAAQAPDVEVRVIQDLLNVTLPTLPNLSQPDLVAVRHTEEALANWRGALERGLGSLHALDQEFLDPQNEALRTIKQELEEEHERVYDDIDRSLFLEPILADHLQFRIGVVSARGVAPVLSSDAAHASRGVTLALLVSYVTGLASTSAGEVHRHYLRFPYSWPADRAL